MAAGPIFQWIHTSTAVAGLEEDLVAVGLFPALLTMAGGTIARPTAVDGFNWRDNAANLPVQWATAGAKTDAAFGWITVAGPTSMLAADGTAVAGIETVTATATGIGVITAQMLTWSSHVPPMTCTATTARPTLAAACVC